MKHNTSVFILIAAILLSAPSLSAQNYYADTVWTKVTDQSMGFYQVKFSNNDSIIVGHGYEMDLFFDANTGNEIARIPGINEVFFINNDLNFIKLNSQRNCFEIFDAITYLVIDTLENDEVKLLPHYSLSNDESKLVCVKTGGLRVWDIATKKIIITKDLMTVQNLVKTDFGNIGFNCDDTKILLGMDKTYQISVSPPSQYMVSDIVIFNTNTLDSISAFNGFSYFVLSNNCQYIAFQLASDNFGVSIYNYNTKKLIKQFPINGFSLTGIEFSPDDKYIVTSNGPGANSLIVWDVLTGLKHYSFPSGSYDNMDISNDGKKIVTSTGRYLFLLNSKFGDTPVPEITNFYKILYPNPTTGEVNFKTSLKHIETIKIYDINGNEYPHDNWEELEDNIINFNVSSLPSGKYIIKISGLNEIQSFNLIINK